MVNCIYVFLYFDNLSKIKINDNFFNLKKLIDKLLNYLNSSIFFGIIKFKICNSIKIIKNTKINLYDWLWFVILESIKFHGCKMLIYLLISLIKIKKI